MNAVVGEEYGESWRCSCAIGADDDLESVGGELVQLGNERRWIAERSLPTSCSNHRNIRSFRSCGHCPDGTLAVLQNSVERYVKPRKLIVAVVIVRDCAARASERVREVGIFAPNVGCSVA